MRPRHIAMLEKLKDFAFTCHETYNLDKAWLKRLKEQVQDLQAQTNALQNKNDTLQTELGNTQAKLTEQVAMSKQLRQSWKNL